MGSFSADVTKWTKKAMADFERLRRAVIIELFSSTILDTPVDQGRLRGNWQIASTIVKGVVEVTVTQESSESKSGKEWQSPTGPVSRSTTTSVRKAVELGKIDKDQSVFLTNNLPYAYKIEYDGWSHTKAPAGMVRKNFIRVSQNLKKQYG